MGQPVPDLQRSLERHRALERRAGVAGKVLLGVVALAAFAAAWRWPYRADLGETWRGVAFVAGALMYVGVFGIGNNWDYRLVILVLLLPQLFTWTGGDRRHKVIGASGIGLIVAVTWLSALEEWVVQRPFDEPFHWVLVAFVAYVLASDALRVFSGSRVLLGPSRPGPA